VALVVKKGLSDNHSGGITDGIGGAN